MHGIKSQGSLFNNQCTDEHVLIFDIKEGDAPAVRIGQTIVKIDPGYFRSTKVETILGNPTKAKSAWAGYQKFPQGKRAERGRGRSGRIRKTVPFKGLKD